MSGKSQQILRLDPSVDLVFKGPFTDVVTSTLTLENPSNDAVIFKVKTTAPKQYCVRPNSGLLKSKDTATISVMLQPFDHNVGEKSKHKFMVQTMYAPPDFQLENLDTVWKETPKQKLMDSKLRCVFIEGDPAAAAQNPPMRTVQEVTPPDNDAAASSGNEDAFKSSLEDSGQATEKTSPQSTAGSTPAHIGAGGSKEMEKAAIDSKLRVMQDKIDSLGSENNQLKNETNKLRQRLGVSSSSSSHLRPQPPRASGPPQLSLLAILLILVAIILGYLVGKWL